MEEEPAFPDVPTHRSGTLRYIPYTYQNPHSIPTRFDMTQHDPRSAIHDPLCGLSTLEDLKHAKISASESALHFRMQMRY